MEPRKSMVGTLMFCVLAGGLLNCDPALLPNPAGCSSALKSGRSAKEQTKTCADCDIERDLCLRKKLIKQEEQEICLSKFEACQEKYCQPQTPPPAKVSPPVVPPPPAESEPSEVRESPHLQREPSYHPDYKQEGNRAPDASGYSPSNYAPEPSPEEGSPSEDYSQE